MKYSVPGTAWGTLDILCPSIFQKAGEVVIIILILIIKSEAVKG